MGSASILSGHSCASCGPSRTQHQRVSRPLPSRNTRQRVGSGYARRNSFGRAWAQEPGLCQAALDDGSGSLTGYLSMEPGESECDAMPARAGLGRMASLVAARKPEAALACAQQMHSQLVAKASLSLADDLGASKDEAAGRAAKQLYRKLYNQHSAFLSLCCSARRVDLALAYMELLPVIPRAWSMLLRATLQAGKHHLEDPYAAMRQVVDARLAAGLEADCYAATSLVSAARLGGNLAAAQEAFEGAWGAGACNAHLAAAMLQAIAELGSVEDALALMERLQRAVVELDEAAFVSLFKALEPCGDSELVKHFLDVMRQCGVQATSWTASSAIAAAFLAGERDPQWFLDVYAMCRASELHKAPSGHAVCALCTALAGCELSSSEVEAAFDVFSTLHTGSRNAPSPAVYTALLALCSKAGDPFRVLDVWEDVRQDGLAREPSVLCAVLSCCASAARPEVQRVRPALQVYAIQKLVWSLYDSVLAGPAWPSSTSLLASPEEPQVMAEDGGAATRDGDSGRHPMDGQATSERQSIEGLVCYDRRPLLAAFNALLHYCARSGAVEQAISILGLMRGSTAWQLPDDPPLKGSEPAPERRSSSTTRDPHTDSGGQYGPAPDLTSFNTVISGLASAGRHARAAFLLSEMENDGVSPDAVTYASLIHACATSGNLQAAKDVMLSLRSHGVQPTLTAYTALMHACVEDGSQEALSQVSDLLEKMVSEGLKPTAVTYAVVLRACLLRRDASAAFAIYSRAAEEQILLSDACHNTLIKVCVATGRIDDGVEVVKEVSRIHGELQGHTLNALIRAVSNVSVDRALRLLSLMRTRNLKPSHATMIDLVDACARDGNAQVAFGMYRGLSSSKQDFPRSTGSRLLRSLCRAGDKEDALTVYSDMLSNSRGSSEAKGGQKRRRRRRLKYHCLPTAPARASLAFLLAQRGQTEEALEVVKLLAVQEGAEGMSKAARTNKEMFQELIMQFCRQDRIANALYVFDEWKAAFAMLPEEAGPDSRLNTAVLAFLEASCRKHEDYMWRTYDVLAVMRQQQEIGTQAKLERPQKKSHHFTERITRSQ